VIIINKKLTWMIQSELNYYEKLVKKTIATLRLTAIICT